MGAALTVRGVTKSFATPEGGEVHALKDVDLDVEDGAFTVLLGPSGCGKTTLLRCVAGLETPDSGEIMLHGERIDQVPVWKRRVNTVFQSYALFPHMTVERNIAFGLEMDGISRKDTIDKVNEALQMVRLDGLGGRKPSQLSGGQQQRVALARALAKQPEVLLLDEPLSALDLKLRRGMQLELKRLQRETSITFVLVTHDQEEAMAMGDQVAVFDSGEIVQIGAPRDVYLAPRTRFVADFIGEANVLPAEWSGDSISIPGFDDLHRSLIVGSESAGEFVAVRPENVMIEQAESGNGTVIEVLFVGGLLHVEVEVQGSTVSARQSSMVAESGWLPAIGDRVQVGFRAGSVRVVEA